MNDLISRQAVIDSFEAYAEMLRIVLDNTDIVGNEREKFAWGLKLIESFISDMKELPSAETECTCCEYRIGDLCCYSDVKTNMEAMEEGEKSE